MDGINLLGFEALEAKIRALGAAVPEEAIEKGLREGAEIFREAARANLRGHGSVDSGLLANTLEIRGKSVPGQVTVTLRPSSKGAMVVRKGKTKPTRARPSKYAHLVEKGTEHSRAKPFMRPAYDTKKDEAVAKVTEEVSKGLIAEASKHGLPVR